MKIFVAGSLAILMSMFCSVLYSQQHKPLVAKVTAHTVSLSWTDTDPNYPTGLSYNAYRLTGACPASAPATAPGTFTKLNTSLLTSGAFTDSGMTPGTYCYFVTAFVATASPSESGPSNLVSAVVPSPQPQPPVLNNPSTN